MKKVRERKRTQRKKARKQRRTTRHKRTGSRVHRDLI